MELQIATNASARTAQNKLSSPLLKLPAEIRNKILANALGGGHLVLAYNNAYCRDLVTNSNADLPSLESLLALPRTCRQLESETHLLPYTLNTLLVTSGDLDIFIDNMPKDALSSIETLCMPAKYFYTQSDSVAMELQRLPDFPALTKIKLLCTTREEAYFSNLSDWMYMKVLEWAGMVLTVELEVMRT